MGWCCKGAAPAQGARRPRMTGHQPNHAPLLSARSIQGSSTPSRPSGVRIQRVLRLHLRVAPAGLSGAARAMPVVEGCIGGWYKPAETLQLPLLLSPPPPPPALLAQCLLHPPDTAEQCCRWQHTSLVAAVRGSRAASRTHKPPLRRLPLLLRLPLPHPPGSRWLMPRLWSMPTLARPSLPTSASGG